MNLQSYLDSKNITKYRLSQISGIPKTTIMDICSGRSSLKNVLRTQYSSLQKPLVVLWNLLCLWIGIMTAKPDSP